MWNHVENLLKDGKIEFLKGESQRKNACVRGNEGVDYVFHQAAVCLNRCSAFTRGYGSKFSEPTTYLVLQFTRM